MFIIGELFRSLAIFVEIVCQILTWLLIARIVISWFPVDPYHQIVQFLHQTTDPLLAPFRRLPLQIGMLDLTPLVAFLTLSFVARILTQMLRVLAYRFGVQ